ncbi:MAG: ABC transporter permease [Vicinamibacterales bacterium]
MTMFERGYRRLLRWLPPRVREAWSDDMARLAVERLADRRGPARIAWAVRELLDLVATVRRERRADRRAARPAAPSWQADLRHAVAGLRMRRGLVLSATLMLAGGLGAATMGFGLWSSVLLRPLPYGQPDRLVLIWGFVPHLQVGFPEIPLHGLRLRQYRDGIAGVASLEGFKADVFNLAADGQPDAERVDALLTTAGLFDTLRVAPEAGRFFRPGEDAPGVACVAVIGHGLAVRRFGAASDAVGRVVRLNDRPCTLVGVAPRGFDFPRGGEMPASFQYPTHTDLWVASPPPMTGPSDLTVMGRLADGTTTEALQAELDAFALRADEAVPASRGWNGVRVVPLTAQATPGTVVLTVQAIAGAVGVLLLVSIGNALQLFLVRGVGRRTELAVCAALGATPARLARALVLEVGLVVGAAAAIGLGLAALAVSLAARFGPERFPRLSDASLGGGAIAVLAGLAAVAAGVIVAGSWWLVARASGTDALRGGTRGSTQQLRPARRVLVFAQVGLAVMLITASGLLLRSLVSRLQVDPGFDPDGVVTFELTLPPERFPEILRGPRPASRPRVVQAVDDVLARLRRLPGVTDAAMGKPLPMTGAQEASVFVAEQLPPPAAGATPVAEYIVVSDDFFRTLGTPLEDGREFTGADREASEPVVIVNAALARQLEAAGPAVGQRLKLGGSLASPAPWMRVVGVARNVTRYRLEDSPGPAMYVPYTQGGYPSLATVPFAVRTTRRAPLDLRSAIEAAVRDARVDVPVAAVGLLQARVRRASADARFATGLMIGLAAIALGLAVTGLDGSIAFSVSQRTRELGVRAALGARPADLVRLAAGDGWRPAAAGTLAGLAAAVAAGRAFGALLFGVSPADPVTFVVVPVLLVGIVAAASVLPARRAARVDPREMLHRG